MQGSFMKRFFGIGSTAVALAWAVVPFTQAQPVKMKEGCDLAAPSAPHSQTQPRETKKQPQEIQGVAMKKTQPDPRISHPEKSEEYGKAKPERSADSSRARKVKEVAMRKPCREMDDREMDGTCGGITGSYDLTGGGNMLLNDNSVQSISLSDQAQQNLSSLVNIISINSTIQVMMNLNVNINSTVGTVNQGNTGTQTGPP